MQAIRNAVARLIGGVSREDYQAAQERIQALFELSADQQAEIMDKAQQIQANQLVLEAYQEDLQQTSAEVVRLRSALARMKRERADWRDRAMGYREKINGPKRRVRG